MTIIRFQPGQRVRIRQEIDRREGTWHSETVGTILEIREEKTGSWFAHSKDDQLWLRRVKLRKDDGELVSLIVDRFTQIEIAEGTPAQ